MSENAYGWGYLQNMVGTTVGVTGSVQTRVDNTTLTGDSNFTYDGSAVTIAGDLTVNGQTFGYGSPTNISGGRFNIPANGRVVMYTDADETITVSDGATLNIGLGAIVKLKDFATV
tara:strand:+ start:629 stop:976 length:348 start_codon:yes stop_codon:yes gene_type:complete